MTFTRLLVLKLAAMAFLALGMSQASAQEARNFWAENTLDLHDICNLAPNDPQRPQAIHFCLGYIDGAVDYHDVITDHENLKRLVCYPETASLEQAMAVFIVWAQANVTNEKFMKEPPVMGVVRSLEEKWPCT